MCACVQGVAKVPTTSINKYRYRDMPPQQRHDNQNYYFQVGDPYKPSFVINVTGNRGIRNHCHIPTAVLDFSVTLSV